MTPQILILAAGASSRMGDRDKLLLPVNGWPLVTHVALQALGAGVPVAVALPPDRPLRQAALATLPLYLLVLARSHEGMGASLAEAVAALPEETPVLVLLADMPDITTADLKAMLSVWQDHPDQILRATDPLGRPGHPVGFPAWARTELVNLHGDRGAQIVLQRHADRLLHIPLPDARAISDIDTPEDWHKWEGRTT